MVSPAAVEVWTKKLSGEDLSGKKIHIFGGTGPVGLCAGVLAEKCGAQVSIASHRGEEVARGAAREYNTRFDVKIDGISSRTEDEILSIVKGSDIIIGAAKAGIRLVTKAQLQEAGKLMVAADVNAVPPSGIEGVDANDMGKSLDFTPKKAVGIGALAIGNIKYKVHHRMFELMKDAKKALFLDHEQAFAAARELAAKIE